VGTSGIEIQLVDSATGSLGHLARLMDGYRTHFGSASDPEGVLAWLQERIGTTGLTAYLAWAPRGSRAGPEAVGMAVVVRSPASFSLSDYWNVRDLFVAVEHRRRGVARALLDEIVRRATTARVPRLAVQTDEDNAAALSLYRDFGFQPVTGVQQLLLDLPASDREGARIRVIR
jgi:ribosomal protein S18 acetylase RimI-like enzyme